jgi:hypothetical protein
MTYLRACVFKCIFNKIKGLTTYLSLVLYDFYFLPLQFYFLLNLVHVGIRKEGNDTFVGIRKKKEFWPLGVAKLPT